MTEHFTRNTVSAEFYCKRCGGFTQHCVAGGRKGSCLECAARAEREHQEREQAKPAKRCPERQSSLFGGRDE